VSRLLGLSQNLTSQIITPATLAANLTSLQVRVTMSTDTGWNHQLQLGLYNSANFKSSANTLHYLDCTHIQGSLVLPASTSTVAANLGDISAALSALPSLAPAQNYVVGLR
jgi:hypothetical protein